jgi:hypothetical protein
MDETLADVGAPVMRAILFLILAVAIVGCGRDTVDENAAIKNAERIETFNREAMKANPPPPGEGPSF